MSEARHQLRRRLRRRRALIDPATRRDAARVLARRFRQLPGFRRARHIALYSAAGSEIDVWPLIAAVLRAGQRVYLPQVRGQRLRFAPYRSGDRLRRAAFGIREPVADRPAVRVLALDWVVVPLVGFDIRGARLGQGGGFYDRAFAGHRVRSWHKPRLAGAAFDVQRCDRIDTQSWDVSLDLVVTEKRVYRARRKRGDTA